MASASSFLSFCGRCYKPIVPATEGFILSCSDFLCFSCARGTAPERITSCPACQKQGVQALSLREGLPEEVQMSMVDTAANLKSVGETVEFQIKYYKQTMKKMFNRIVNLSKENAHLKQMLQNGPAPGSMRNPDQRPAQPSQFAQNPTTRPSTSLSTMLSAPIHPATQPVSSTVLGKRPDTSQTQAQQMQRPGSQYSSHFQMQDPAAKRAQTAQARPGATDASRGSFQRAMEVSRPVPREERNSVSGGQFALPPPQQPHQVHHQRTQMDAQRSPQLSSARLPSSPSHAHLSDTSLQMTDAEMWGFGGAVATVGGSSYAHSVTPSVNSAHSQQQQMPPPPAVERQVSTPAPSSPYHLSPNTSSHFMTPSRLRSPHLPLPRGSSGGNGRPGSGSTSGIKGPANPLQGVGVTVSQNQMPPPFGVVGGGNPLQSFTRSGGNMS